VEELDPREPGHIDIRDQTSGLVQACEREKLGWRGETLDAVTERPYEPHDGCAKELIVFNDRNERGVLRRFDHRSTNYTAREAPRA
jgi:hypothetical protein